MTAFPKYPAYKSSGVEWLGDVPEHWEANRVFSIFNERVETGQGQLPILSVTISNGVQVEQFEGDRKKRLIEDRDAYKRAAAGDIAYNTMRMWQGAVGDVPVDGLVSPAYVVAKPIKDINSRYYSFLFRGEMFQVETNRHSYGIVSDRNRLYWLGFKNIVVPIPPRAEQDRIVAFLDEKTAEIDRLIAKKQRQIELLDEQKAILINRAVTRGLHPHTELQDSGIPWIGPIPKGWKVVALRRLLSEPLTNGLFKTKQFFGEGTRLVNVGDVYAQDNIINPSGLERVKANSREKASYQVLKGDIFFVRSSLKLEGTGASSMMPDCEEETVFECHVIRGRPKASVIDPEYLIRYLNAASVRSALVADAKTVTMSTLDQQAFLRLPVLVPPQEQQRPICDALRAMFEKFNQAKIQIESQIQTLQTLRSTLIAHAVTGKIKV